MKTLLKVIFLLTIGITFAKCNVSTYFEEYDIVPDLIDNAPTSLAQICYSGNLTLQISEELTPRQVRDQPTVSWNADPYCFYTVILTDLDVPSREAPVEREWHHWLVGNIPGCDVSQGDVLSAYIGSGPAEGTGLHRYVWLVYKQPGKINFSEDRLPNNSVVGRSLFSTRNFTAKYDLGDPVAGTFYLAEYDDSVLALYEQVGLAR